MGSGHWRCLYSHGGVVKHYGEDRYVISGSRLEVQLRHPECGVPHEVNHEFVGRGEFRTDVESKPVGLALAQVRSRASRLIEGHQLVARASRVVGDDSFCRVNIVHELPDDAVGSDGDSIRCELGHPLLQPLLPNECDLFHDCYRSG